MQGPWLGVLEDAPFACDPHDAPSQASLRYYDEGHLSTKSQGIRKSLFRSRSRVVQVQLHIPAFSSRVSGFESVCSCAGSVVVHAIHAHSCSMCGPPAQAIKFVLQYQARQNCASHLALTGCLKRLDSSVSPGTRALVTTRHSCAMSAGHDG